MLRLILLRHAKSAWPEGTSDHDRPLAERGKAAGLLIGQHIAKTHLSPRRIFVSTARRTRETFTQISVSASLPDPVFDPGIYEAPWTRLLSLIRDQAPAVTPIMVIGHNPGIGDLAIALSNPTTSDAQALARLSLKVPTASLIVIDFDVELFSDITPETGRLVQFTTPSLLGGVDED